MASRAVVSITNTMVPHVSKLVTNTVKYMADLKHGTSEIKNSENLKVAVDDLNKKYKDPKNSKRLKKRLLKIYTQKSVDTIINSNMYKYPQNAEKIGSSSWRRYSSNIQVTRA